MGLCRCIKLNDFGENLGWSRLTQTRVHTLYSQLLDVGLRIWQRMMFENQWVFFFSLTRLWFALIRCVAQFCSFKI
jgi:hypothetical protein